MGKEKDKDKDKVFYFIYKNGNKVMVEKEEWEKSWLDWWERSHRNSK